MSTQVINIRQAPSNWQSNPEYVYIGRKGKGQDGYFGNPFRLESGEPRGATLERFREWCVNRMSTDTEYYERVRALKGKTLICFCAPSKCHGDILSEIAESL